MNVLYLETSAVLAWLFGEPNAQKVRLDVDSADIVVSSVLTEIETLRAINRASANHVISAANARRLSGMFAHAKLSWVLFEISPIVRIRAGESFPIEPVRSLDAIHLASALFALESYADLKIISFDDRILNNARALGLDIA